MTVQITRLEHDAAALRQHAARVSVAGVVTAASGVSFDFGRARAGGRGQQLRHGPADAA